MPFSLESDSSPFGIKKVTAEAMGWSTIMFQCPRGGLPTSNEPAVYVLLSENRKVCYIGETGRGKDGGIHSRLTTHQNRIPWWTHCVYFTDPAFADENLRLWLEANLHASVLSDVIAVSHAGRPPVCLNGPLFLERIQEMCAALCVPLFEIHPVQTWESRTALAKAIAKKFNPGQNCANYINQVLTPRIDKKTGRITMPGKYQSLLQRLGVRFAADGRVSSWAYVARPLPDLEPPYFPQ